MLSACEEDQKAGMVAVKGESLFFYHRSAKHSPTLKGIDITVPKGIIYGLLGPSGCGKTTLLGCIVGRLTPKAGSISVYGRKPGESGFCIPGRGVGYMPQELALYGEITVAETLRYFGRLFQLDHARISERISFLLKLLDLQKEHTLVRNLSGGQQRRVSFAVALIHKPPLLILDEPTVGVDPLLRKSIWEHLVTLATEERVTIIITTHYVEEARQAHMVALMREGRLLAQMNPDKLMKKHNASNLEDVFLKLCRKDNEANETSCSTSNFLENNMNCCANQESLSEVWIPRESPVKKEKTPEKIIDNCHYKCTNGGPMESLLKTEPSSTESVYETQTSVQRIKEAMVRLSALMSKSFIQTRRNVGFTAFQIFIPVIQVIIFCLCIGGKPFDLPLSIVNMEKDAEGLGGRFIKSLDNTTFRLQHRSNLSIGIEDVRNGDAWGVAYIGPKFTDCLSDRFLDSSEATNETIDCSEVKLYLDMTNQIVSLTIYGDFLESFQKFAAVALEDAHYNPRLADPPVALVAPIYGQRYAKFSEFMAPGVILAITYIMAVGLTAISIIMEKKSGLLDRVWVSGVTHGEVIFSILFNLFVIMVIQVTLVLLFTFLAFDTPVLGSVFWVVICVLMVGICGMTYGLLISALCDDETAAVLVALGSFTSNLLTSGAIWPVEGMAHYLRIISYCLPWTIITNTLRAILSKGWAIGDHEIYLGCFITIGWTTVFLLGAWFLFKYRK